MRADDERACDNCGATLHVDPTYGDHGLDVHGVVRIACAACGFHTFSTERWALMDVSALLDKKKAVGE